MKNFAMRLFFLVGLAAVSTVSEAEGVKVKSVWFDKAPCSELKIERFEAGRETSTHAIRVSDPTGIKNLISEIEKIPADGDEMKSHRPKETLNLEFQCSNGVKKIEVFDGAFKTPTTGFNSNSKARKLEKQLYSELMATLKPALKGKIFKFANVEFVFPDFTIVFKGMTKFDHAPATISGEIDHFEIRAQDGKIQKLEVVSGQLPPQPEAFSVGTKKFVLETFSSKDVGPLYSSYFQIHR